MNTAARNCAARTLRDWMVESDEWTSPQAAVLSPGATVRIAAAIVAEPDPYRRTVAAAREAVSIIRAGIDGGRWKPPAKEQQWLDRIEASLGELPEDEAPLLAEARELYGALFDPASYGLAG